MKATEHPRCGRIAAPMVGGVVTSFVLELLVYPVIFTLWRGRRVRRGAAA